jgi:hypothetical protein
MQVFDDRFQAESGWNCSSILHPDSAGFFNDISPSDSTMALGSTQPLVKMSIRNIPGRKGGRCARLTTSPPSRAECHEIWEPKPPGTLWATPGLLWDSFTFTTVTPLECIPHWNSSAPSCQQYCLGVITIIRCVNILRVTQRIILSFLLILGK